PLVAPLLSGHSEVISRFYNALLHLTLGSRFRDAQCGFKECARMPPVGCCPGSAIARGSSIPSCWCWRSARACAFAEVPVDRDDDPDSRVSILPTALEHARHLAPDAHSSLPRSAAECSRLN